MMKNDKKVGKVEKVVKIKKTTVTQLKKKADKVFSLVIRARSSLRLGDTTFSRCQCYTCGKELDFNRSYAGHLFRRSKLNTRYNLNNAQVQCYACNVLNKGNYDEYYIKFLKENESRALLELYKLSKIPCQFNVNDYEWIIKTLTAQLEVLGALELLEKYK